MYLQALEFIKANISEFKIKRVKMLPVSGAFHTKLMKPAADGLQKAMTNTRFAPAVVPVHSNVDGYVCLLHMRCILHSFVSYINSRNSVVLSPSLGTASMAFYYIVDLGITCVLAIVIIITQLDFYCTVEFTSLKHQGTVRVFEFEL